MKEIKIQIDESCNSCKKGLIYLEKLYKKNKNVYGNFVFNPVSKKVKNKRINGIVLTPDYNSEGHLTHFHIKEQKLKGGNK